MDKETLKALREEAKKNARAAEKRFNKYDNTDDMHDWEAWLLTVNWLEGKIKSGD